MTSKTLKALIKLGIGPETHHATLKKAYKTVMGEQPTKAQVDEIRKALTLGTNETPPVRTKAAKPKPRPSAASPEFLGAISGIEGPAKILEVTAVTSRGKPARVLIACADPQTNGQGESVCQDTRDIAVQDTFQVFRCMSCQRRAKQVYRNMLARRRRSNEKERLEAKAAKKAK